MRKSSKSSANGSSEDDYEVGYKKPPKQTQFKPGQSGNPKGRPKGSRSMSKIVEDLLSKNVSVRVNGKERKMPFREAFIHRLAARVMDGSPKDMIALLKAINEHFPEALEPDEQITGIVVEFVRPEPREDDD